ncbi:unnamed protein product [Amoebophrya sp. A25]|nr:unnamed protein product [Amoebophrya sp. A25]|eukprot:GSA25T00001042001.1
MTTMAGQPFEWGSLYLAKRQRPVSDLEIEHELASKMRKMGTDCHIGSAAAVPPASTSLSSGSFSTGGSSGSRAPLFGDHTHTITRGPASAERRTAQQESNSSLGSHWSLKNNDGSEDGGFNSSLRFPPLQQGDVGRDISEVFLPPGVQRGSNIVGQQRQRQLEQMTSISPATPRARGSGRGSSATGGDSMHEWQWDEEPPPPPEKLSRRELAEQSGGNDDSVEIEEDDNILDEEESLTRRFEDEPGRGERDPNQFALMPYLTPDQIREAQTRQPGIPRPIPTDRPIAHVHMGDKHQRRGLTQGGELPSVVRDQMRRRNEVPPVGLSIVPWDQHQAQLQNFSQNLLSSSQGWADIMTSAPQVDDDGDNMMVDSG